MPILDYTHLFSTSNTTKHYGMPDASKEGPSLAKRLRVQVERPGNRTVDIHNKGITRTEATDSDKGITTKLTDTIVEQTAREDNLTQEVNGTIIAADE